MAVTPLPLELLLRWRAPIMTPAIDQRARLSQPRAQEAHPGRPDFPSRAVAEQLLMVLAQEQGEEWDTGTWWAQQDSNL